MRKKIIVPVLAAMILLLTAGPSMAAEKGKKSALKTVVGVVTDFSIDDDIITIEYKIKKKTVEMRLLVDEETTYKNMEALNDLKSGDTVTIKYRIEDDTATEVTKKLPKAKKKEKKGKKKPKKK